MDIFAKPVYCKTNRNVKLRKCSIFEQNNFVDDYGLSVGGEYHLERTHVCMIEGTPIGSVELQLASLREKPGEYFLRCAFSE